MSFSNIDYTQELEAFNAHSDITVPYFKILLKGKKYHVFEGAIGQDRYQYFVIGENTAAGQICAAFIDKYERRNHVRVEYYEEGMALLGACQSQAEKSAQGAPAYQMYWDEYLSGKDKIGLDFYSIPFFDPLMDWFTMQLAVRATEQAANLKSPLTQKAQQQRWIRDLYQKVSDYIEDSKMTPNRQWSAMTVLHAVELLQFRDWLLTFLKPSSDILTFDDFSADFAEGPAYIDTSVNSATGVTDIFYSVNGKRYSVPLFWIFFKDHHTRLALAETDYAQKLLHLRRLAPQFRLLRDKNYDNLITKFGLEPSQAEVVLFNATRVIGTIEAHIEDIQRFLSETKKKTAKHSKSGKLSGAVIKKIIASIQHAGKHIEQQPSLHRGKDEEGIRDVFVLRLNSMEDTGTTTSGETFNKNGKTDICVKTLDGVSIFIGECKVWNGAEDFYRALTQLIDRYIDGHIERAALLFFVRNKGFTKICQTMQRSILTHNYFVKVLGKSEGHHASVLCKLPEDPDATIQVEIMAFHFYEQKKELL